MTRTIKGENVRAILKEQKLMLNILVRVRNIAQLQVHEILKLFKAFELKGSFEMARLVKSWH